MKRSDHSYSILGLLEVHSSRLEKTATSCPMCILMCTNSMDLDLFSFVFKYMQKLCAGLAQVT